MSDPQLNTPQNAREAQSRNGSGLGLGHRELGIGTWSRVTAPINAPTAHTYNLREPADKVGALRAINVITNTARSRSATPLLPAPFPSQVDRVMTTPQIAQRYTKIKIYARRAPKVSRQGIKKKQGNDDGPKKTRSWKKTIPPNGKKENQTNNRINRTQQKKSREGGT